MDLLGSILGTMTGPPKASQQEQEKRKKDREMAQKIEDKQREFTKLFRQKIEKTISEFVSNNQLKKKSFGPMTIVERQVVKDVSEIAGVVAHTFGEEGVDRHVVVWKKEFSPCEDELNALRHGKVWDPVVAAKEKEERFLRQKQEEEEDKKQSKQKMVPKTNYQEKYHHLIGADAALSAARKTEMKKSFGMVSAESKKDKRTMEEIQADIKAKKKLKLNADNHNDA